jgi:hypothetical protein
MTGVDPDVRRLFEEFKAFNVELINRFDASMKRIDRRMEAQTEQMRAQTEQMRAQTEQMLEQAGAMREQAGAMRDMRLEIQANTQGLLHVLDELRGSA